MTVTKIKTGIIRHLRMHGMLPSTSPTLNSSKGCELTKFKKIAQVKSQSNGDFLPALKQNRLNNCELKQPNYFTKFLKADPKIR